MEIIEHLTSLNITLHMVSVFALAFAAMFATTFLRGFQNKNVAGGHKKLAFWCGATMTAFEGLVMLMLAKTGEPAVIFFTAFGSGFGWVFGMMAHDRLMKKRVKALKKLKKSKRRRRMENIAGDLLEERLRELGII